MSNRKKAQWRDGNNARTTAQDETQRLIAALQTLTDDMRARAESRAVARRFWCGGSDPVPADVPNWPEDSLGDRFFSGMLLEQARLAPCLVTAAVPAASVIAADPAHWNVAMAVLVRAVLLDRVRADNPVVKTLLSALAPIAEAEFAFGQSANPATYRGGTGQLADEPEFAEQDGPLFLLGTCALIDATWAVIGPDPLHEVLGVLEPLLGAALPGLDGQVVAEALVRGVTHHYQCESPGDEKVLERLASPGSGNPLEDLAAARVLAPGDALTVGLTVLAALGELSASGSASVLRVAA